MGFTGGLVVNGILIWFSGFTILKELKEIIKHRYDLTEVLIVNATVCKLPAVFRYPVDELFQNTSDTPSVTSIGV